MTLRKVTKNRGSFPTQEAAIKLLYLALQNVSRKWHTVQGWREALRAVCHPLARPHRAGPDSVSQTLSMMVSTAFTQKS